MISTKPDSKKILLLILIFPFFFSGCGLKSQFQKVDNRPFESLNFYSQTDLAVKKENISNAYGDKICGFPYLRSDRFLFFLKNGLKTKDEKIAWAKYLKKTDIDSRIPEIKNLSESAFKALKKTLNFKGDKELFIRKLKEHSDILFNKDLENPHFFKTLRENIRSSEDYSTAMRFFGGYYFAYGPVAYFSSRVFEKMKKKMRVPREKLKIHGKILGYSAPLKYNYNRSRIKEIFQNSRKDPLGIQIFKKEEKDILLHAFAPRYDQDFVKSYDHIGEVIWKDNILSVNAKKPVVYYYFSNTFYKDKPVLQINYIIWYSRRDGPVTWYEKGVLDGINFRVTLNQKGTPLMVDVVHQCGCFHFFIPNRQFVKKIKNQTLKFNALVPHYLPPSYPEKRVALRIATGGHLVDNLSYAKKKDRIIYKFLPYKTLLSLPFGKKRKSMFDEKGIGIGTERFEPYFLFPMGVPEIGAMRQRGHHPTKLVGKAHFDDPMFFNNAFEFK